MPLRAKGRGALRQARDPCLPAREDSGFAAFVSNQEAEDRQVSDSSWHRTLFWIGSPHGAQRRKWAWFPIRGEERRPSARRSFPQISGSPCSQPIPTSSGSTILQRKIIGEQRGRTDWRAWSRARRAPRAGRPDGPGPGAAPARMRLIAPCWPWDSREQPLLPVQPRYSLGSLYGCVERPQRQPSRHYAAWVISRRPGRCSGDVTVGDGVISRRCHLPAGAITEGCAGSIWAGSALPPQEQRRGCLLGPGDVAAISARATGRCHRDITRQPGIPTEGAGSCRSSPRERPVYGMPSEPGPHPLPLLAPLPTMLTPWTGRATIGQRRTGSSAPE